MVASNIPLEILRLLEERNYGLTIQEVSNSLEINRSTASKYLAMLEYGNKLIVRRVGKAKLHYPEKQKILLRHDSYSLLSNKEAKNPRNDLGK